METNQPSFFEKLNQWIKNSVSIRLLTIGFLILLLLIPVSMIEGLIHERETRQKEAIDEVSTIWGKEQTLTGLVLTVPYKTYTKIYDDSKNSDFKIVESKSFAHFLPEQLSIHGNISPEVRYRGIYEVIVYNSKLTISGSFLNPDFKALKIDPATVLWDEARLSIGISDLRSIRENTSLRWNNDSLFFNPGIESTEIMESGISTFVQLSANDTITNKCTFEMQLNFNGSNYLKFIPLGKLTNVQIQSVWKNPSFTGAFLPETREVNEEGFKAEWKVLHLNRPYPQSFVGSANGIQESAFGVNLIVPVDEYQKSMRSAKYAVMFITLTFIIYFFVQVLLQVRIHPIQYIMIGLSLCLFYTLLIAISEHMSFAVSYLIAASSIITLITLYTKSVFKNKRLTGLIAMLLILLYVFIFTIIQMEDYALLMGSIGLFFVMTTAMYLSRKIDWYNTQKNQE